ncbi:glutamate-5-semialdehyde dehydrogenase [Ruminococcus sp.]|uniref:glutamate-5-semialdehyde dehydrogenase n=1 Tax=Ruminococcus sp. TaxID=41978 RepID=UPI0025D84CCC|nr:glutamate-5-semialdehyde dehydrogenase [Ruminococcus sp.]MCI5816774.1 glutamate-5-semialdehyde dehydrogenase [Ruminococcus sp.]
MTDVMELGKRAQAAAPIIAAAAPAVKNAALAAIADALVANTEEIVRKNAEDLERAVANGMSQTMQDRLLLNPQRIVAIAASVRTLIDMDDVVGSVEQGTIRPNGLQILKTRVPLGVIGIIFESRPNVTVDAATLCLKAGNAVILRGGKEALCSNACLVSVMRDAVASAGLPQDVVQFVEDTSHEAAEQMMRMNDYLDVLSPRGGAGLIRAVVEHATVPVIQTGTGNCHVYVDDSADLEMAVNIIDNGKTQRPSVCNAVESLLVHQDIARQALPLIKARLDEHKVIIHGCPVTRSILGPDVQPATEEDYAREYLSYDISVKVVDSIEEAIAHIARYGTKHSEAIVTSSLEHARLFQTRVDAAAVYVNASTRFTDGGEFGMGAEIGISTQKLHARGPMGLRELTTVKYLINGDGQIR